MLIKGLASKLFIMSGHTLTGLYCIIEVTAIKGFIKRSATCLKINRIKKINNTFLNKYQHYHLISVSSNTLLEDAILKNELIPSIF